MAVAAAAAVAGLRGRAGHETGPARAARYFTSSRIAAARSARHALPRTDRVSSSARNGTARPPSSFSSTPTQGMLCLSTFRPPRSWRSRASGEMNLALVVRADAQRSVRGTLAQVPMTGGAPHEIREKVQDADWAPDGSTMVLVRDVAAGAQLEFPRDKILYKTVGHISYARISPKGDRIAFLDHPARIDDGGTVVVVDLAGRKTHDRRAVHLGAGPGLVARRHARSGSPPPARLARELFAVEPLRKAAQHLRRARQPHGARHLEIRTRAHDARSRADLRARRRARATAEERDLSWLNWTLVIDLSEDGKSAALRKRAARRTWSVCGRPTARRSFA